MQFASTDPLHAQFGPEHVVIGPTPGAVTPTELIGRKNRNTTMTVIMTPSRITPRLGLFLSDEVVSPVVVTVFPTGVPTS